MLTALGAFALGAATRTLAPRWPDARAAMRAGAPAVGPAPAAGECVDPRAMAANATLVDEAHACHAALTTAKTEAERERALASARARSATSILGALGMSREDWAQAARTGAMVLRTPCATYQGRGMIEVVRREQRRLSGGSAPDKRARVEAAGLSPEELSAVDDAYAHAHARTWAKLRTACAALADEETEAESATPFERVVSCRHLAVAKVDAATVGRLAELRSSDHGPSRATHPEDAVLLALVESQEELARALTDALGVEKATRAVAFGVTCSDETFVFAPPATPT